MERRFDPLREESWIASLRTAGHLLAGPESLDPLLERIGEARYVLLGEASHGTSEHYTWRPRIGERLIREEGFSFLAVEGDWPDCYRVNRYVKGALNAGESAHEVLSAFDRWPTWMWANREVGALAEWLRQFNDDLPAEKRVGFYGLDIYSLWDSMHAVVEYLNRIDPFEPKGPWSGYKPRNLAFFLREEDARGYEEALRRYQEAGGRGRAA